MDYNNQYNNQYGGQHNSYAQPNYGLPQGQYNAQAGAYTNFNVDPALFATAQQPQQQQHHGNNNQRNSHGHHGHNAFNAMHTPATVLSGFPMPQQYIGAPVPVIPAPQAQQHYQAQPPAPSAIAAVANNNNNNNNNGRGKQQHNQQQPKQQQQQQQQNQPKQQQQQQQPKQQQNNQQQPKQQQQQQPKQQQQQNQPKQQQQQQNQQQPKQQNQQAATANSNANNSGNAGKKAALPKAEQAPKAEAAEMSAAERAEAVVDSAALASEVDKTVQWADEGKVLGARNVAFENAAFANMKTGINFSMYDSIKVEVRGTFPGLTPLATFSQFPMPPFMRNSITLAGYDVPTPIQKYSLPIAGAGSLRDIMACAQTGSGKTVAFLLPLLQRYAMGLIPWAHKRGDSLLMVKDPKGGALHKKFAPSAMILAPTRELAIQIAEEADKFGYRSPLKTVLVYGGTRQQGSSLLSCKADILIATPGRLIEYYDQHLITLSQVQYLVVDEADRMLDMGFEPQVSKIVFKFDMTKDRTRTAALVAEAEAAKIKVSPLYRQTLMFSATFPTAIQKMARDFLASDFMYLAVGVVGATSELVTQTFAYVATEDKFDLLVNELKERNDRTVLFMEQKHKCNKMVAALAKEGIQAAAIHGNKSQAQREDALRAFKADEVKVLVATDVAARGLDIPEVATVVNFDLPIVFDSYVHRIGRTGRCGHTGTSITFLNENSPVSALRELRNALQDAKTTAVPDFVDKLIALNGRNATEKPPQQGRGGRGTKVHDHEGFGQLSTKFMKENGIEIPKPTVINPRGGGQQKKQQQGQGHGHGHGQQQQQQGQKQQQQGQGKGQGQGQGQQQQKQGGQQQQQQKQQQQGQGQRGGNRR